MLPLLLSTVASSLTQGGGGLGGVGSMFGGGSQEQDVPVKSTATGTFTGGGLTITKADNTLIIGLIVVGVVVALAVWRKARR